MCIPVVNNIEKVLNISKKIEEKKYFYDYSYILMKLNTEQGKLLCFVLSCFDLSFFP